MCWQCIDIISKEDEFQYKYNSLKRELRNNSRVSYELDDLRLSVVIVNSDTISCTLAFFPLHLCTQRRSVYPCAAACSANFDTLRRSVSVYVNEREKSPAYAGSKSNY